MIIEAPIEEIWSTLGPIFLVFFVFLLFKFWLFPGRRRKRSKRNHKRRHKPSTGNYQPLSKAQQQIESPPHNKYRYKPANSGRLLTVAESKFYEVLKQAVGDVYDIQYKVRVADVLEPYVQQSNPEWQGMFNKIKAKDFDFVLCDPTTHEVKVIVELNDRSHQKAERMERDRFLSDACRQAGVKLVFVEVKTDYLVDDIRSRLLT